MPSPNATFHTRQIRDGEALVLRRRKLRLLVEKGPDRKLRRDFDADRVVLGSHESCDLALSDRTISRQHCEIALSREGYIIRDLDSTNGTFLDRGNVRIREIVVDGETRIRLGDTSVRIQPLDETVDIPLGHDIRCGPLLGRSPAMRRVFDIVRRVAPSDATVLITGESGTGKEIAARALHEHSGRADGPFVVVDCGALPGNLIESELYGHERGAFTGAISARAGAFEAANGGTLFLDELGEMPLDLQTRLLGVLERRVVQRLGSTSSRAIDVRVLAATNRDLRREVNRKNFREDLYFRLAVVTIEMPPLRDRPEDIALYVEDFLRDSAGGVRIDAPTMERLAQQPWPGNVRELRNVIERAMALGEVDVPGGGTRASEREHSLPQVGGEIDVEVPFKVGKAALIEEFERNYVERLMAKHEGNITQAARAAEIDRVYLLRVLDKYGMRPSRRK
ncbi:sigma 54-interacting transcriptional regulator [Haliangium ochraceum]|uniref:Sigma54 specific transcriptional regulator, Fis family n=1 Tax=Haliangium ochraceum (strain DSM 14365 / JCM 11303 / SMP-2) TaxID=502025 RepID=D0LXC8_HALO1|nr:sigma 54-interacting transcriptional regulator [Haliangium ochraceum]ACY16170.1 sigma54 specific transcriptional regulator, Fis family [Haliangium ochraceum DSM 14365]